MEMMHVDFAAELQKLLREEEQPLIDPMAELARASAGCLENIQKTDANLALQIEEIYDIIKDFAGNEKEIKAARIRENTLLSGLVALSDLLDSLFSHVQGNNGHIQAVSAKMTEIVNACGLEPLGFLGERLDPRIHTASSAEFNDAPPESIVRILERGYAYRGKILRKATVILSKGVENP